MIYEKRFSIQASREFGVTVHIRFGRTVYMFGYAAQHKEFYKYQFSLDGVAR